MTNHPLGSDPIMPPPPYSPGTQPIIAAPLPIVAPIVPMPTQTFVAAQPAPMPAPPSAPFSPTNAVNTPGMPASAYALPAGKVSEPNLVEQPPLELHERVYHFLVDSLTPEGDTFSAQDLDLLHYCLNEFNDTAIAEAVKRYEDGQAALVRIRNKYQPQIQSILDRQYPYRMKRTDLASQKVQTIRAQDLNLEADLVSQIQANEKIISDYADQINGIAALQNAELSPYQSSFSMDLHQLVIDFIDQHPAEVLTIIQDALVLKAKTAEARIAALTAQHQSEIDADHESFIAFYDEKTMKVLKPLTDGIAAAQGNIDAYEKMIQDKEEFLNATSNRIQAGMEALGNVIGFLCHSHGYDKPTSEQITRVLNELIVKYSGQTHIEMDAGALASMLGGGNPVLYQGPDAGGVATQILNDMSVLNTQTAVLKDTWVPLAQDQIKASQDAIQWSVDAYNANQKNFSEDWYIQATLIDFQSAKQKAIVAKLMDQGYITASMNQARVNQIVEQMSGVTDEKKLIRAVNDHMLLMHAQMKRLIFDLENAALTQNGVTVPDFMNHPYEKQRAVYFGVCNYVNENKEKFKGVSENVNQLSQKLLTNDATEEDQQHLQLAQQAMKTMMLANHVKLKLESDEGFLDQLRNDTIYGHLYEEMLGRSA